MFIAIPPCMAIGFLTCFILIPAWLAWYYLSIKDLTENLQKSTEKLSYSDVNKNVAESAGLPLLVFFQLSSGAALLVLTLWCIKAIGGPLHTYPVVLMIPFAFMMMVCLFSYSRMISIKLKDRNGDG